MTACVACGEPGAVYPACLAIGLPLAFVDLVSRRPGVIDFWARK